MSVVEHLTTDTVQHCIDALREDGYLHLDRQRWCADVMEALLALVDLPGQQELGL